MHIARRFNELLSCGFYFFIWPGLGVALGCNFRWDFFFFFFFFCQWIGFAWHLDFVGRFLFLLLFWYDSLEKKRKKERKKGRKKGRKKEGRRKKERKKAKKRERKKEGKKERKGLDGVKDVGGEGGNIITLNAHTHLLHLFGSYQATLWNHLISCDYSKPLNLKCKCTMSAMPPYYITSYPSPHYHDSQGINSELE